MLRPIKLALKPLQVSSEDMDFWIIFLVLSRKHLVVIFIQSTTAGNLIFIPWSKSKLWFEKNFNVYFRPFTPNERTVIGFGKSKSRFDLISNHMTWKLGEPDFVKKHMPVDSYKFSIIRDPVTHLTSSWKYFFHTQSYMPPSEKADILVKRLNKPEEFYNQLINDTYLPHYRFYLRSQLFRSGLRTEFSSWC